MIEYEIREIIESNELIRMCSKYFDSDTVEQGIQELVDALTEE